MLTENRVHELAAKLAEAGQPVTLARIREANGHSGSLSTISRYLATWRQGRSATAEAEARRDPAMDAVERLAPGTYARVVARVEDLHRSKLADLRADLDAMQIDRGALVAALTASEERVDELAKLASAAQSERAVTIDALATVRVLSADVQILTSLVATLTDTSLATRALLSESIERVHVESSKTLEGIETQVAELGEQFRGGLANVHEQMAAESAAASGRSDRERVEMRASTIEQIALASSAFSAQVASLSNTQRTQFLRTQKAIAGLSAATRLSVQATKEYR